MTGMVQGSRSGRTLWAVSLTAVGILIGVAGCAAAPELVPAPGAQPAPPGPGKGATAEVAGIRVIARSEAWSGFPTNLDRVTPIMVTIENDGAAPLRLRYNEFSLVDPASGRRYAAVPPFNVRGVEAEPVTDLGFSGFWVAPYYAPYFPGIQPYRGAFPFDRIYYDEFFPTWVNIELPTGDMIQKALPEGVLDPGGRVTGYLYFQNVKRGTGMVEFTAELVTVTNGESLAVVRIPFQVE